MSFVKKICVSFSIHILLAVLYNKVYTDDAIPIKPAAIESTKEVTLDDDNDHTWTSPNPYPPNPYKQELIIKCKDGYSISFTINRLDLDGGSRDFLVIKPGTTLEGDGEGKVFTYMLKNNKTFLIHDTNAFLSFQVYGENLAKKSGFSLTYKRVGTAKMPIPEPPTTLPPPLENISTDLIAYVSGKTAQDFKTVNVVSDFKNSVTQMAVEYCKSNNFLLSKEITVENVELRYVTQCPLSWPEYDTCIKINFAVPVTLADNSTLHGYQLTTLHLDRMWYSVGNKYLQQYGMSIYTQPSKKSTIKWWIIILCSTIVFFSILLYLLKVLGTGFPKYQLKKKRMNGINTLPGFIRSNPLTLNPYPYAQSTPPIFGYDGCDYKQCEADITAPRQPIPAKIGRSLYDSDDDILYSNDDIPRKAKDVSAQESYT